MSDMPKPGDVVGDRFAVVKLLGQGYFGTVYEALDLRSDSRCVLKIFRKGVGESFAEYTDHLSELRKSLAGLSIPSLLLPIDVGETESFFYEVSHYIQPMRRSLDAVIQKEVPLHPSRVLDIVAKVANALDGLHTHDVIHGDIKPANIIVSDSPRSQIYLVYFGMAQHVEADDSILLVGTYQYMHPKLKGDLGALPETSSEGATLRGHVGTYIDIYALGVVTLQMLTGEVEVPRPLSERRLAAFVQEKNPTLDAAGSRVLDQLVNLLFQMLAIRPGDSGISAHTISSVSTGLARTFQERKVLESKTRKPVETVSWLESAAVPRENATHGLRAALLQLELIAKSLATSTGIMIRTTKWLQSAFSHEADSNMLAEINTAFTNALARTRTSWRVGVAMTIVSFCLIVGMISCAIILTFVTGKSGWALIFGGASVPMVIGTLLWRPYDRVFRATILAQQLEMIHVQTTAVFRSTTDLDRRIQTCREAIERLQTLLEEQAVPEERGKTTNRRRKNK